MSLVFTSTQTFFQLVDNKRLFAFHVQIRVMSANHVSIDQSQQINAYIDVPGQHFVCNLGS